MDKIKQESYFSSTSTEICDSTGSYSISKPAHSDPDDPYGHGAMLDNALLALKFKYKTLVAETLFALGMEEHRLQIAMPLQGQGGMAT